MKNVKRIDFRVKIKGSGIVNYDDKEQKRIFNNFKTEKTQIHRLGYKHDNITYAKKNIYIDENGELQYKLKLSEGFLANSIFRDDYVAQHPNVLIYNKHLMYSYLATPASILRGYLINDKGSISINRKSSFSFPGAEQTSNSISFIETLSRSGQKEQNEKETNKSDNSFFKKESVGNIEYAGEGSINLAELQFVSCDQQYDRFSFHPDFFDLYKKYLQMKMPNFNSELGYYQLKTSCIQIPELGFRFSNENIVFLVKEFLQRLYKINIQKRNGYVKVSELQYKLIDDVVEDMENREDGWVTIKSFKDIEKLNFETEEFYVLQDKKETEKMLNDLKEAINKAKDKAKEEKVEKQAKIDKKKEKAKSE